MILQDTSSTYRSYIHNLDGSVGRHVGGGMICGKVQRQYMTGLGKASSSLGTGSGRYCREVHACSVAGSEDVGGRLGSVCGWYCKDIHKSQKECKMEAGGQYLGVLYRGTYMLSGRFRGIWRVGSRS